MPLINEEEARQCAERRMSPRFRRIDILERYVDGSVYDSRPDFFASDRPLLERKPIIVYPVFRNAIREHADLTLGENRFPAIVPATPEEDDDESDDDETPKAKANPKAAKPSTAAPFTGAVAKEDAKLLERLIRKVVRQAKVKPWARAALESDLATGSAVQIASVKAGRLHIQHVKTKWCTAERDADDVVVKLTIEYPFLHESYDAQAKAWRVDCKLYKRVIDAQMDTVYLPADASKEELTWKVDTAKTVAHGLGFCPVHWHRFLKPSPAEDDQDGDAIHKFLTDEADALNIGLSQRARAAHYCGDPQIYETGVDEGPPTNGRSPRPIISDSGGFALSERVRPQRKKGAGTVWSYESELVKVDMLTLPGDALEAMDANCRDIRGKLLESLAWMPIDPDSTHLAKDLSGKAVELLMSRQLNFVNQVREDFGDNALVPVLLLLLRVAYTVHARKPGSVYLEGLAEAAPVLATFVRPTNDNGAVWMPCELELRWPPVLRNSAADDKATVETTQLAKDAGLICPETATRAVAPIFGVEDIEHELEEIAEAKEEHGSLELAMVEAQAKAKAGVATGNDDDAPGARQEAA